eukprot:TRINITY_DN9334_c0_g1_i1.p1 TRINITY_DN9334_c0_g1~~TRINITY_DN9334_c0_g1_i1.p1  ORF type:complete len:253 (-),score=65.05 TRINITY_DN9334_c0_g1_i1:113-871(-)
MEIGRPFVLDRNKPLPPRPKHDAEVVNAVESDDDEEGPPPLPPPVIPPELQSTQIQKLYEQKYANTEFRDRIGRETAPEDETLDDQSEKTNNEDIEEIVIEGPLVKLLAIHPFVGGEDGDLPFNKGDVIYLLSKEDDPWWFGELNDKQGMFPSNYVKELPPDTEEDPNLAEKSSELKEEKPPTNISPNKDTESRYLVARFPYTRGEPGDLEFKSGDIIRLVDKEEDPWWRGELNGKIGLFPSNFVNELPVES